MEFYGIKTLSCIRLWLHTQCLLVGCIHCFHRFHYRKYYFYYVFSDSQIFSPQYSCCKLRTICCSDEYGVKHEFWETYTVLIQHTICISLRFVLCRVFKHKPESFEFELADMLHLFSHTMGGFRPNDVSLLLNCKHVHTNTSKQMTKAIPTSPPQPGSNSKIG